MAGQLHHSVKGWKVAIASLALQKHQQAVFQSIEFGLAGTLGHLRKQLDLSKYVPRKNLGKEQKENFCKAPVDSVDLTIGRFSLCSQGLFFLPLLRVAGSIAKCGLFRVHEK